MEPGKKPSCLGYIYRGLYYTVELESKRVFFCGSCCFIAVGVEIITKDPSLMNSPTVGVRLGEGGKPIAGASWPFSSHQNYYCTRQGSENYPFCRDQTMQMYGINGVLVGFPG